MSQFSNHNIYSELHIIILYTQFEKAGDPFLSHGYAKARQKFTSNCEFQHLVLLKPNMQHVQAEKKGSQDGALRGTGMFFF